MLIPQSLAYALLAGLPAQVGLYASMAPLLLYAVFGTSRTPGGRARGGGQPDDRGRRQRRSRPRARRSTWGRPSRSPWSRGCCCSPWGCCGWGSSRTSSATRSSRASSPPRASRSRPASSRPSSASTRRARPSSRSSSRSCRNLGQINPSTAAIGLASLAFLFWVRRGLKPLLLRVGLGERTAGHAREGRPRRGHRRDHRRGLGLRAGPAAASRSSARCPRACPGSPCRRSTWRSGRRSSSPRC